MRVELRQWTRMVRVAAFDEGPGFTAEAPHVERDQSGGWVPYSSSIGSLTAERIPTRADAASDGYAVSTWRNCVRKLPGGSSTKSRATGAAGTCRTQ